MMKLSIFFVLTCLVATAALDTVLEESFRHNIRGSLEQNERRLTCQYGYYYRSGLCCAKDWYADDHCRQFDNFIPKAGRTCYNNVHDCECAVGYTYDYNGPNCCADDSVNHCNSLCTDCVPKEHRNCYNNIDDCTCEYGYHFKHLDNTQQCCADDGGSHCHSYSSVAVPIAHRTCYNSFDDCDCPSGYHKNGETCEPDVPVVVTTTTATATESFTTTTTSTTPDATTTTTSPGGYGDPHFHTWHDQDFEFHGGCDLVMLKAPKIDLDVHVRTTIEYDYSYISEVSVRMGNDVFQVASWGEYMLNDMDNIDLPATVGENHEISMQRVNKKKVIYTIKLGSGVDIQIVAFKHFVSVKVLHGNMDLFQNASGMMGHFETTGGDMYARDGVTVMDLKDPDAIGAEWQVRPQVDGMFFSEKRYPQYPAPCELPAIEIARPRKLGEADVSKEDAEKACAGVVEGRRMNCISDVMKTGDKEMAESY